MVNSITDQARRKVLGAKQPLSSHREEISRALGAHGAEYTSRTLRTNACPPSSAETMVSAPSPRLARDRS
jgi:hypothetical protein